RLMAFVVSSNGPVQQVDLGRLPPIVKAIDRWRSCLGNWTGPADQDPGQELRRLLWSPVAPLIGTATTVLLSPDGALAQLPFAALPGDRAGEFLLHLYGFATIPVPQLLPTLLQAEKRLAADASTSMLLVGGVDYGGRPGKVDATGVSRAVERSASLA